MTTVNTYSTGTVSIGANATSVVGTGSNWTGQNAMSGDLLSVSGFAPVMVVDVTDATHLTIDAWPFSAVSAGSTYKIYQTSSLRIAGVQTAQEVDKLVTALNTNGFYVFVGPSDTVPDPSLGDDNQYALQATTGKIWQKVGGVWTFVATFKGFGTPAAWSGATAYIAFDVVTLNGTSYVCILANTNQTPPNATYWTVLAAKGDTGATGATGSTGAGYGGTSTTSLAIGTGSQTFATQAGLAYQVSNYVRASSAASGVNFMEGTVTAYSGTSLTLNATKVGGSGTHVDWNFQIAGAPGSGDLLSTNNLSDVANPVTALSNLGGTAKSANLSDVANADTALSNLHGVSTNAQTLTSAQQLQARHNIGTSIGVPDVIIEEQQPSGTNGGTNTAGSFVPRVLNTLVRNNGSIASLASNNVTLPAGTYFFKWSVPAYAVDGHQSRLRNVTDSTWVAVGTPGWSPSAGGTLAHSEGSCVATISGSKAFSLYQYTTTSQANAGLGRALGQATEVYSRLEITALS